tara:strand:- start:345 stop:905 length:561 start_codon:yes stop_codon:yes gene_type:complete
MRAIQKRGALELSVSTIVVVVLAMSMLILGLVLVRNIFTGAIDNVDSINDKTKAELNKLFNDEDQKVVVNLPDNTVKIRKKDGDGSVSFVIKNTVKGESDSGRFNYEVSVGEVEQSCSSLSEVQAQTYISIGSVDSFTLSPGDVVGRTVKLRVPESAPLCEIRYDIDIFKDNLVYESTSFFLKITS